MRGLAPAVLYLRFQIKIIVCVFSLLIITTMLRFLAVASGGALGAMLRYGASILINHLYKGPAPLATWSVNMLGCLLIGFLVPFFKVSPAAVPVQVFILVGFLGSLTTFSTFSIESVVLWQNGHTGLLLMNAVGSVLAGVLFVWLGMQAHALTAS